MRHAARVDGNQAEIVAALRQVGAVVMDLHGVGGGVPDLSVEFRGKCFLVEVKSSQKARLTPAQVRRMGSWPGPVAVVWNVRGALEAIGLEVVGGTE